MFASSLPLRHSLVHPLHKIHRALVLRQAILRQAIRRRPLPPSPTPTHPRPPQHELRRAFVRPRASSAKHLSRHWVELCVGLLLMGRHLHSTIAVGPSSPSRKTAGTTTPSSALVEWRYLATLLMARHLELPMALLVASSTPRGPAHGRLLPRPRSLTSISLNTPEVGILPFNLHLRQVTFLSGHQWP
jgi:hypothetical protein